MSQNAKIWRGVRISNLKLSLNSTTYYDERRKYKARQN